MQSTSADVVVVGGGVIGSAVTYFLAKAGLSVALLERDRVGAHTSSVAAGILGPTAESRGAGPFFEMGLASLRMFRDLAPALREESGVETEFSQCGVLRVASSESEEAALRARAEALVSAGLDAQWLGPEDLAHLEPGLASGLSGGLWCPQEGQVSSARLTIAFAQAAARRGATILEGTPVLGLVTEGGRVRGLRTTRGVVAAERVVLACGAWTGCLEDGLPLRVPVEPERGQLMVVQKVPTPVRSVVFHGHTYLVPKADGTVLVGATSERVGFDRRTTVGGVLHVLEQAQRLLPGLVEAELVGTRAGLRPASPDGLPLLGPVPGWDDLYLAAGHYRNGILLSPITGHLMAQVVLGHSPDLDLGPFAPGRFIRSKTGD